MRLKRAGALMLMVGLVIGLTSCDPAIARRKGVVSSAQVGDDSEICLENTADAGSTYGDKSPRAEECAIGIMQGPVPKPGDCIILRTQGETSDLIVTPAEGC